MSRLTGIARQIGRLQRVDADFAKAVELFGLLGRDDRLAFADELRAQGFAWRVQCGCRLVREERWAAA